MPNLRLENTLFSNVSFIECSTERNCMGAHCRNPIGTWHRLSIEWDERASCTNMLIEKMG